MHVGAPVFLPELNNKLGQFQGSATGFLLEPNPRYHPIIYDGEWESQIGVGTIDVISQEPSREATRSETDDRVFIIHVLQVSFVFGDKSRQRSADSPPPISPPFALW